QEQAGRNWGRTSRCDCCFHAPAWQTGATRKMDLTGQLHNLSARLQSLLELPLPQASGRPRDDVGRPQSPIFRRRHYELIRHAVVEELAAEGSGLRLMEIRRRVEKRIGEPIGPTRFKDYVNDQS